MKFHKLSTHFWRVTYKNQVFIGTWEKIQKEVTSWN